MLYCVQYRLGNQRVKPISNLHEIKVPQPNQGRGDERYRAQSQWGIVTRIL